ncbi:MAG: hypothetical protein R3A79_31780 [Nannocystaceae bacterium]
MRRLGPPLCTALLPALLAAAFSGCAAKAPRHGVAEMAAPGAPMAADASFDGAMADAGAAAEMAAPTEAIAPVMVDRDDGYDRSIRAGTLTAGTFDDTLNPATLQAFARTLMESEWTAEVAAAIHGPLTVVTVVDGAGAPLADVGVTIENQQGRATKTLRTGTDGRVVILSGWDLAGAQGDAVMVRAAGTQARVQLGTTDARITARDQLARPVRALDLALVVDATGSMGDEIEYLKVELASIVGAIERAYPEVDQRYALVVYRDQGDAYVTRSFDFVSSLGRFERSLGRQHANGGGDYPEAMDRALVDASGLGWRDYGARALFLVADAPPHPEAMGATLGALEELRGQGVAIYPVAASGVATEAEAVMRAAAAMSGGEYIFLTDDSGVGNTHAEPHIPCYTVLSLRDAMLRAIESELVGQRLEAAPGRTIRAVGQGERGVCKTSKAQLAG